ncbi:MAG: hypothetical protein ACPGRX_06480, partial [Bdellovibrionales bacterium]
TAVFGPTIANPTTPGNGGLFTGDNGNPTAVFRRLVELHVKPYYLHHPDFAPGTSHFRLPIARGQEIMKALQGRLSGLCLPTYMLDIPGGHGKIPLTPCYIQQLESDTYTLTNYKGQHFHYPSKAS